MGWLWGPRNSSEDDPRKHLDRELKDFLEKETPKNRKPATPRAPSQSVQPTNVEEPQASRQESGPRTPSESLFQDGRYAHLWKNYRPLIEIEEANKSDQEKLMDVLEAYKYRRKSVGRMALENCALEQAALHECYANGSYADRMVLCRTQNKAFSRCYTVQAQFLRSLGYISTYDRPASVDEEIQMHADTLYHRMLAQEKAIEATGDPVPEEELISPATATIAMAKGIFTPKEEDKEEDLPALSDFLQDKVKPEAQYDLRKKMKGMNANEKELYEKQLLSQYEVENEVARLRWTILEDRKKRRAEGKGTISDTISGWLGW